MSTIDQANTTEEWGRAIEKPVAPEYESNSELVVGETVDVAIVGGGLVGLAVAIGLRKKTPQLNIKVYERAPELRNQSQGILAIHPNGLNALKSIDPEIQNRILEAGCERHTRIITNINADGSVKETVSDTKSDSVEKYGQAAVGITWHNCQQVLASLVPRREETIMTSRCLTHFVEQDESVMLFFESGSAVRTKIMLACDGVFSAVRRQLYPNDSPIYFGQLNWGTVIESSKLPRNLHPKNGVHYFQHHGDPKWMSMLNDGGSGYTFWQFRVSDLKHSMELSGNNGRGGLGLPCVKDKLVRIAKESCETVANAIEAIPEGQIFERSIVGHSSLPSWRSPGGRVALVGDAAHGMHPNIAQGANSAFESAAAIVKVLCHECVEVSTLPQAMKAYEEARKPRADLVQGFANALGVSQASGNNAFHDCPAASAKMMDWIRSSRDPMKYPPPKEVTNILNQFDPLKEKGVSRLWG